MTDANLALGYLGAGSTLAGGLRLDADAAERALRKLGHPLGLSIEETASGVAQVADHEMIRALRVVTVERGVDPRRYALVAFGGAGPMHAARIAEELEIGRVLCPRAAGVLSALGLVVSDRRRDVARSVLLSGADLTRERVAAAVANLAEVARGDMPDGHIEVTYDVRYQGQSFELAVEGPERPEPSELRQRFEQAHQERYGYSDEEAELELVNVRVAAIEPGAKPELDETGETPAAPVRRSSRPALFGKERLDTEVVTGELPPGERVEGPAVVELPEATAVVPPGWRGYVQNEGTLVLERRR